MKLISVLLSLLSYIRIRTKILIIAGTLLAMLAVVSTIALYSLNKTRTDVSGMVKLRQPLTVASLKLNQALASANSALGFYLTSGEQTHQLNYKATLGKVNSSIEEIKQILSGVDDEATTKLISRIESQVRQYAEYQDRMIELVQDARKNQPGFDYSAGNMEPVATEIQQYLSQMLTAEDAETEATLERKKLLYILSDLRQNWMNVLINNRAFLAFRGEANVANIRLFREGFVKNIQRLKTKSDILNFEQQEAVDAINELQEKYFRMQDELIKIHGGEKWRTDAYLVRTEIGPLVESINNDINTLVEAQVSTTKSISDELLTDVSSTTNIVSILLVASVIIGIAISWFMAVLIARPIARAVSALNDIAEGEGDLTQRLNARGRDEIAQLAGGFNKFIEKVQGIIRQVSGSTTQLATASEQMSTVVAATKDGIQRQRNETDLVATAMNEMVATVQEVALNADNAARQAEEANQEAINGKATISKNIHSIEVLADEVRKASDVIDGLQKDSEAIGSVLDVIQGIAEQTNLLALNAAIEAARAGEQGRGFAVVADEVRNLASRTAQSTQEIQGMIERLQKGASNAVVVMHSGSEQAAESVKQAAGADKALVAITSAVEDISRMNAQIAASAGQQGTVAEEININVNNISLVAEQSAQSATEISKSSDELAKLSIELQSLVAQFKI